MPTIEVAKAWKDEEYRDTLTAEQLAELPEHPAGVIEFGQPQLADEALFGVVGGRCKFFTNGNQTQNKNCLTTGGRCK